MLNLTRLCIFIDYDNFTISYGSAHHVKRKDIDVWDTLNSNLIKLYAEAFCNPEFERVVHCGTYVCVGVGEHRLTNKEMQLRKFFKSLDREQGYIFKYGHRKPPKQKDGQVQLGEEKGVDAEIICQMLMGAFLDHYDVCILMSDDSDYLPAVHRVQDYFNKKVIQAGFHDSRLRNQSYGHIALEEAGKMLDVSG
ncbi:MAG: NYN domain-containing protein [candidate division KSB1 bacterium]|nr:NYN domain-containing protein [candidate division KSB1 bacterium]